MTDRLCFICERRPLPKWWSNLAWSLTEEGK